MNTIPNYYNVSNNNDYYEPHFVAYDDSVSQERRKLIREHYDSWHMPYYSIYENEKKLPTNAFNSLICEIRSHNDIQQIPNTTIYRGQTLIDKECTLKYLKNKKIKTVIDLVGYGQSYKEKVNKAGLDFYAFSIYDNWWNNKEYDSPEFIQKLVNFLHKMQEGNIYIGCQHGSNDTDIALILNNLFNPQFEDKAETTIKPTEFSFELNTIFDTLTKSDKKKLGWTQEFEKRLSAKLIKI